MSASKAQTDDQTKRFNERMADLAGEAREATVRDGWRPTGRQAFKEMPKAEQDEALGPDVAEAVRTGEVKLEDLTVRSGEDFITQAPAKDLGITNESEEE